MSGRPPVDPTAAVVDVPDVGWTIVSGRPPVDPTSTAAVDVVAEDAEVLGSDVTVVVVGWTIVSGTPPVEPTALVSEVDDGGGGGGGGADDELDEETRGGLEGGSKTVFPVPLAAGLGETTTVVVLVESENEDEDDDCDDRWKNDSKNDETSPCDFLVSSSGVLLDEELEVVDVAGWVEFVTICRLICRGK